MANKNDLENALSPGEISNQLGLSHIVDRPYHIQSSCALTGEGLKEGMNWVSQQLIGV